MGVPMEHDRMSWWKKFAWVIVGECKTFVQALQRPLPPPKFILALWKPKNIKGELGFVFSDAEVERVAEDLKFALVMKFFSRRPLIRCFAA